ncbi:N-acetylmuramoyl-L-alanine amidase [Romboutsia maritimum]|uniref:N-acetylmuramoyl-L-alanine amidase n=1 Tax=Romboutsia maritimum TaxID=2020948 RepID=A0A371IR01_9FIRM|nr:N-acetylmuramoyl-L-alanine amidase [Romboutsia maritimum]RDY22894.1 N-acetylmuramoyl-L-alanine amidase [Romboutsia maritimum]
MKICLTVGHSKLKNSNTTSASGYVNEYEYNKILAPKVAELIRKEGHDVTVIQCPEYVFTSSREEYLYKIIRINRGDYDLLVEFHLNASNGAGYGAEVLHFDNNRGKQLAQQIQSRLKTVFRDRCIKQRQDLYILRDTNPTAVLIEAFFCDNANDCNIAKNLGYDKIAKLIAEGILNKNICIETKEDFDMDKIVLYFGDADLFSAVLVSQKHQCPLMKKSDFDVAKLKVKEIIQIGGNKEDSNRFITMKNACKYL